MEQTTVPLHLNTISPSTSQPHFTSSRVTQIYSRGFDAAPLAEFLSKHTPVPVPYREPIDWTSGALTAILGLCVLLTLRFASPILQSRWLWALGVISVTLVMISGYMFTRIRSMPYVGGGGWIAPGFQSQYGQEVHVVAFICTLCFCPFSYNKRLIFPLDGLLSFSFLMLILAVPNTPSANRQRAQVYLWSAVIFIIYSVLISLFRVKNRSYPFKLFL